MSDEYFKAALQKLEAEQLATAMVARCLLMSAPPQVHDEVRRMATLLPDLLLKHKLTDKQIHDIPTHMLALLPGACRHDQS